MTDHELACARALAGVRFMPASPPKRFARDCAWAATHDPGRELTTSQSLWLSCLVWRHRRQIKDKVLVAACGVRTSCGSYGPRRSREWSA